MLISVENKNTLLIIHKDPTSLCLIFFDDVAQTLLKTTQVTNTSEFKIDRFPRTLHPLTHQQTQTETYMQQAIKMLIGPYRKHQKQIHPLVLDVNIDIHIS